MAETTAPASTPATKRGPKKHFLEALGREYERTLRLLRAFPADKADFKPHEKSSSARDVAYTLARGSALMTKALTTGFDWSKPGAPPPTPETMAEVVKAVETQYGQLVETATRMQEAELDETVQFFVAPKTLGDVTKMDFLWMVLFDHVHHRGQLSVYMRMLDAKVPSIYGPSADEPWR